MYMKAESRIETILEDNGRIRISVYARWWPGYLKDYLAGLPTLLATEMYLVLHVRCADAISYQLP